MGSTERSDIDTLRERLDALEARHRRMYRAVTAAAVAVVATLALGAARKHRVEADEIVVRDEAGTVRLRLGMVDTTESPVLGGRVGAGSAEPPALRKGRGPAITMFGADGSQAAEIVVYVDGHPSLRLRSPNGGSEAHLAVDPLGSAHLAFTRGPRDHGDFAFLGIQADRGPYVWLVDGRGGSFSAAPQPVTGSK